MSETVKVVKKVRICNICHYPEPPKVADEKDETLYCLGHQGIHYRLWNLSPSYDGTGDRIPGFKDWQRYVLRMKTKLGQEVKTNLAGEAL